MTDTLYKIAQSWTQTEGRVSSNAEILAWINERNQTVNVEIFKNRLEDSQVWYYDEAEGCIRNQNASFFRICGLTGLKDGKSFLEQPVIIQDEIGYLGILCKEIEGVMHFLMQAKIEPGNLNKIQLSPTIQATRSNFTQKHGGKKPPYLDYFLNADGYEVVLDQIQSEQSARFYKKRNRNIMIRVEEELEILPSHRWMTLGQIKTLMRHDNLVNMDTRTVLSCIPYCREAWPEDALFALKGHFSNPERFASLFCARKSMVPYLYRKLNDYKMFDETQTRLVPLKSLEGWKENENGEIVCARPWPFKVVFCDIAIEGREVKHWTQPLFEAVGIASFGLLLTVEEGIEKALIRITPEIGCMDHAEFGPSVQEEAGFDQERDAIAKLFWMRVKEGRGLCFDQLLSEEGGRFYHEQNRNLIVKIEREALRELPEGYFLADLRSLCELMQSNNTMNIQLRNLLSVLEA